MSARWRDAAEPEPPLSTVMAVLAVVVLIAVIVGAFLVGQHRQCAWKAAHHSADVAAYCGSDGAR